MATIRQIAHSAQVSPMTVSFVLNNKPGQVSEETRERVLHVVREMGYKPRASSERPGSEAHVSTLGIVSGVRRPEFTTNGYYTTLLNSLMVAADEQRQNLTLFTSSLFHADPRQSIRTYCDGRTDGLLVVAPGPENELVPALHERGIACVLLGDGGHHNVSSVDVDNPEAMFDMTALLIEQGHRKIAFFGFPGQFVRSASERQDGYRAALRSAGLPICHEYILDADWKDEPINARLNALARMPRSERPTALVCWNDQSARRALTILRDAGLRVPEDMSVTGFDDEIIDDEAQAQMTTVQQPYAELASQAISLLRKHIAQKPAQRAAERIRLPGRIILRGSVAAPPWEAPRAAAKQPATTPRLAGRQSRKEAMLFGSGS